MSKTNTSRKHYVINAADAAEFTLAIYDANKIGGLTRNSKGDITIGFLKLDGWITIQVKSSKVVARISHPDFPRIEDQILFVKRYFSKKSLMAVADALNAEIKVLTDKVDAKKAAEQSKPELVKKQKNNKVETPVEIKVGTVKKKHGKNRLGHIYGTIADELDNLFLSNVTEEELLEAGYTPVRIKSHFRHLLKDKASLVDVKFENGQYFAKYID